MPELLQNDINTRADIEQLVEAFYSRVLADTEIGFIFTGVAQLNLAHHLPVICDFWESVLLNKPVYDRNTMQVHLELNRKYPLTAAHFVRWLAIFNSTANRLFAGPVIELAKTRAASIARIMQIKMGIVPAK